jgi:F0F1-type ATP synthase assembly protein I
VALLQLSPKALVASSLVFELSALAIGGLLLGNWLDERLGCAPLLLTLLPFLGLLIGLLRILRVLQRFERDREQ